MGSLLSLSQECHPFPPSYLAHDLVVNAGVANKIEKAILVFGREVMPYISIKKE